VSSSIPGSATNDVLIRAQDLHKTYGEGEGAVLALKGVDFEVRQGEFLAVMGPSGSGKSTLLHVLACLHKSSQGSYLLAGTAVEGLNDTQLSSLRNKEVGIVFQKFNLLPQEDIVQNVVLPLAYGGVPRRERERRAGLILGGLGLGERLDHLPTELSGGEDQRVAIARALVASPAVIFADEPTGNLDSRTSEEILSIFQKLNQMGKTLVMITHNRAIAECAQRIIHLKDGRIVGDERVAQPRKAEGKDIDLAFLDEAVPKPARSLTTLLAAWLETVKVAVRGLGVHKVRAFLSMLGIIFGVASVMAVLSVVAGARGEVMKQMKALGANNILVSAKVPSREKIKDVQIRARGLTLADGERLAQSCRLVEYWAPLKKARTSVTLTDKLVECEVVGTTQDFLNVTEFELAEGRFLSALDDQHCLRVCVIEEEIRKEQFPLREAVGELIGIGHEPYTIIGVLKAKETTESKFDVVDIKRLNRRIYIPISCALNRLTQPTMGHQIDEFSIKIVSFNLLRTAAEIINAFFEKAHEAAGLTSEQRDYEVKIAIDLLRKTQKTELIFDVVMACSAGISLLVGGIGIMNIMLANVTERRREVGIRRSVGARQVDVLKQFLFEAVSICLLGGLLGVLLGLILTWGITTFAHWKTAVSVLGILLALIVSLADGVVFGTYPAWKAAKMDPIEALQYE